jgi:hypothetical protein
MIMKVVVLILNYAVCPRPVDIAALPYLNAAQ